MKYASKRGHITRGLVGGTIAAGLMLGASTLAGADPKSEPFTLTCEDGTATQITANGNGNWTPGHDTASNTMYIPVVFGEFHGTVLDAEGNIVDEFSEGEVEVKGRSAKHKGDVVDCTFSFVEVSDGSDPEFPEGYTFIGEGDVSVIRTPRR